MTEEQYTKLEPVNPALAIKVIDGDNSLNQSLPALLGISYQRGIDLITAMDSAKKQMMGSNPDISTPDVISIISYVTNTPGELAYLVYITSTAINESNPLTKLAKALRR